MAKPQVELQREYRQRKRRKDVCGWDGCWLPTVLGMYGGVLKHRYYCYSHGEHFNALRRARRQQVAA